MNSFERRSRTVGLINTQGSVLIMDLSNTSGIFEVTIRVDLRLLEEKGLVIRSYDGTAEPGSHLAEGDNQEVLLEDRYQPASDPKKRIAQTATAMAEEGMTVILDSGSTALLITEALNRKSGIAVITSSLPAAFTLSGNEDITLVVCGGTVYHKTHSMHDIIAECSLQGIGTDLMFVSVDRIDTINGVTTSSEGCLINSVTMAAAHKVIAVLDATKFNRRGFNQVLPVERANCVMTDDSISKQDKSTPAKTGAELLVA